MWAESKMNRQQWVAEAAREVLLDQLLKIEFNRELWCRTQKADALHDLRVAIRRSRALLGQLKGDLPEALAPYRKELARLGAISGPLRDLDVLQEAFLPSGICAQADADLSETVRQLLGEERKERQAQLSLQLQAEPAASFSQRWATALEPLLRVEGELLGSVADRQIARNLEKLLAKGARLKRTSSDRQYHRLRIRGKKLRYLLEFFAPLYPSGLSEQVVKELKQLQELLGQGQDYSAWRRWLAGSLAAMSADLLRRGDEMFAAGQQQCRQQFASRFAQFAESEACLRLQRLLEA